MTAVKLHLKRTPALAVAAGAALACSFTFFHSRPEADGFSVAHPGAQSGPTRAESTEIDREETSGGKPDDEPAPGVDRGFSPLLVQVDSMLSEAERESEESRRERMLVHTVAWIERQGLPAILEIAKIENPSEMMSEAKARLLDHLTKRDPKTAASAALSDPTAISTVLASWANRNLAEATEWAGQLPEGESKFQALLSVAAETVRTDPGAALKIACDLPASSERDALLSRATSEWTAGAPADALAWVAQIADAPLRARLTAAIASTLAQSDSATAAQLALTSLEPGTLRDNLVVGIVQRWTQRDAASAAAWVANFPEGDLRAAAIDNIVKLWPSRTEAATWLSGLTPGASRDNGLRAFAEKIAPAYPREAAIWAATITNPQMQAAQLEDIVGSWKASDPASASQWVRTATLSSAVRQRLLAKL